MGLCYVTSGFAEKVILEPFIIFYDPVSKIFKGKDKSIQHMLGKLKYLKIELKPTYMVVWNWI